MSDRSQSPDDPGSRERSAKGSDLARLLRLAGPRLPVPGDRAARVEAVARERWLSAIGRRRARRRRVALAAAAAMLIGVAGWLGLREAKPPEILASVERIVGEATVDGSGLQEAQRLEVGALLRTGPLSRLALAVTEGPSLRLGGDTEVRLVERGALELVEGAVYIDSPPGADRVVVRTRWGAVEEIGTQFEVRSGAEGLRVRIREGGVVLRTAEASFEASPDEASGIELQLTATGELERRTISRYGRTWEWMADVAPTFRAEGRTLAEFLSWFSRETGRNVRFADQELALDAASVELHGSVSELSPEDALDALLQTAKLGHRRVGPHYEITRSAR